MAAQQLPPRIMFVRDIKLSRLVSRRFHGIVLLIPCRVSIQGEGSSCQDVLSRSRLSENLKEASIILKKASEHECEGSMMPFAYQGSLSD
jgi:hypothetical protein